MTIGPARAPDPSLMLVGNYVVTREGYELAQELVGKQMAQQVFVGLGGMAVTAVPPPAGVINVTNPGASDHVDISFGRPQAEQQWGASISPPSHTVTATAPTLTYSQGFDRSVDLAHASQMMVLGKYPDNVSYVERNASTYTVDRPWGWSPMYNAGSVRGAIEANGPIGFTNQTYTGTFGLETRQVFGAGITPELLKK